MAKTAHVKNSLVETGKNLGSGLVGMVTGSAVGRHSLWIGAVTIFGGAWYQHDWLTSAGVGMVASNGFSAASEPEVSGMDGFQDEVTNAKSRALSSLKAIGKKVYLDKLSPSLSEKLGLGEPADGSVIMLDGQVEDIGNFDTSEVDEIIRQLEAGDATNLIDQPEMQGADLGALGNADVTELAGTDVLELNAVA